MENLLLAQNWGVSHVLRSPGPRPSETVGFLNTVCSAPSIWRAHDNKHHSGAMRGLNLPTQGESSPNDHGTPDTSDTTTPNESLSLSRPHKKTRGYSRAKKRRGQEGAGTLTSGTTVLSSIRAAMTSSWKRKGSSPYDSEGRCFRHDKGVKTGD